MLIDYCNVVEASRDRLNQLMSYLEMLLARGYSVAQPL